MQSYSFLKEVYSSFDDEKPVYRKRVRKGWHTPESRHNARSGTLKSFASITTKYNNVYGQEDPSNN